MTYLILFIGGMVFLSICLPTIQSIGDLINSSIEALQSRFNVYTTKNNVQMAKLSMELEQPSSTQAIGFHAQSEEEYVDEDDEECKNLHHIGFVGK